METVNLIKLQQKHEDLKKELNANHQPIKSLKTFSNNFNVNEKLKFISSLDKGIRGTCSMILDFFEARVNTDIKDEKYMIVYTSHAEIAEQLGLSRKWVCTCINKMLEKSNCIFEKVRQGCNKTNYYIMSAKKKMKEILSELNKVEKEIYLEKIKIAQEKKNAANDNNNSNTPNKKKKNFNTKKDSTFNDFKQRDYDFQDLKNKLLGWDNLDEDIPNDYVPDTIE